MSERLVIHLLTCLPKNLLSRVFGWVARRRRPRWLVRAMNRWWADHFRVDLEEAEHPPERYETLLAFFTRALVPGARPIDPDPRVLVSPVDGTIGAFGRIEGDRLLQAKGREYSLEALLGSAAAAAPFRDGAFATIYLSPRDYHRIHCPLAGRVVSTLYEPGTLWPVNRAAVRVIPRLFQVNERVTSCLETERGPVAVCMVGATNVGSIALTYDELVTNRGGGREQREHRPPRELAKGDHLATFQLGSTVVLLAGGDGFAWEELEEGQWIAFGTRLGRYS